MLMGKSVFKAEPYQIQCIHLEDTIGMGYVACRLFDMSNISKRIKSSKPDFLYTEREFWEFYPERDLNWSIWKAMESLQKSFREVMQFSWTQDYVWMGTFHTLVKPVSEQRGLDSLGGMKRAVIRSAEWRPERRWSMLKLLAKMKNL